MVIQCAHCGTALPRDDARFCNNCGTPVPPPSSLHQSASVDESPAPSNAPKPAMREQIAQLPPFRPAHQSAHAPSPAELHNPASDVPNANPVNRDVQQKNAEEREQFRQPATLATNREQARKTIEVEQEESPDSSLEKNAAESEQKTLFEKKPEQFQTLPEVERKGLLTQAAEAKRMQQRRGVGDVGDVGDVDRTQQVQPSFKWPAPVTHIAGSAPIPQKEEDASEQKDFPAPHVRRPQSNPATPFINAWERDDILSLITPKPKDEAIENLPTQQLGNSFETPSAQKPASTGNSAPGFVEMLNTVPVLPQQAKPGNPPSLVPSTPPLPDEYAVDPMQRQYGSENRAVGMPQAGARPQFIQGIQGLKVALSAPLAQASAVSGSLMRPGRKLLPLIAVVVVLVVILGGLGTWIAVAQPFSVSPVTQPWQSFNDKSLGFSLLYPNNDWRVKIDSAQSTVHFSDSSNTAQVNVMVTSASTGDLSQYLTQQAKHLGLSSAKAGAPISFAGASWQQIQGSTQQSGANYRGTILATVHNNRLYTITQLAPLSNYADQETVVFSSMRKSMRFV